MTMTSVLVTGAAGFIGSAVTSQLRAEGLRVRAVDIHPGQGNSVEVADLLLRESAYRVTEGVDAVVHLANWPNPHRTGATQTLVENVTMTQHLFQAIVDRGIPKVVYASSIQAFSGHVHLEEGKPSGLPYLPLDGDIPARPSNTYGVSKGAGELQCRWMADKHGVAVAAIRFPAVLRRSFAEMRRQSSRHGFVPLLDEAFLCMHISDAARLVSCVLRRHGAGYRCVQGGSASHSRPGTVSELYAKHFSDVPLRRPLAELTAFCDLEGLARDFGYVPQVDLAQEPATESTTK